MPINPEIPLGVKVPDQFTTLSNIMNLRRAKIELERAKATLPSDIAQRQAESQSAQAHRDVNVANIKPLIAQQAAQTATAQTQAKGAEFKLTAEQKQKAMDITNAFSNDADFNFKDAPDKSKYTLDKANDYASDLKGYTEKKQAAMIAKIYGSIPMMQSYGIPIDKAIEQADALANLAKTRPEAVPDALKHAMAAGVSGNAQREMITPQFQNVGATQQNINPVVNAAPLQNTVAPGGQESIETDASGVKHVLSKSPQGTILSTRPVPGSVSPTGEPSAGGFTQYTPGQAQDIANSQQDVTVTRNAADQVPIQRNINSNILKLLKDGDSGPLKKFLLETKVGGQLFGDNFQELSKYLEKNAIANLQSMGGAPSDARLAASMAATGSPGYNPGPLKDITKFNDATNTALEKYRQGLDKAVGTSNPKFAKHPEFRSQWAQNLDVDVFRVENAIRDGDTMELQKIKKELGPDRMKKLAEKTRNLEKLSRDGRL